MLTNMAKVGGRIDKTIGLNAGRSGVRIPSRGKCSLRTIAVDARVNFPVYLYFEKDASPLLSNILADVSIHEDSNDKLK